MSNVLVGSTYFRIIENVCENCHVTFEEEGVDQTTLNDLRTTWQKKLTANHVANFPWEPTPVPQATATPASVPSNVSRSQAAAAANASTSNSSTGGVHVKTEPGTTNDLHNLPQAQNNGVYSQSHTALQRAQQHLHEKFGDSAREQVNQLQARAALASQGGQQQRALPNQQSLNEEQRRQLAEQQRKMYMQQQRQQQQQQQYHQQQQRAALNNAQTDGAAEWNSMVAQRRAEALLGDETRIKADLTFRQHVERMSQEMEGGGLMMPQSERSKQPVPKKRKTIADTMASAGTLSNEPLATQHVPRISQVDGNNDVDDDDEVSIKDDPDIDEDAINSDLDDPDDNVVDETEEDGQPGQIMLCVYDKVQRVKNKWKCTLKDGVLTTGGKEYLFNKAQGEFEW